MFSLRVLGGVDLRDGSGTSIQSVLTQPKRLAFLAYLALARPLGFHRRDSLVSLFWPDSDQDHARASLRKAIHYLRRSLGQDAIVGRGECEVGIGEGILVCDALDFQTLLAHSRESDAIEVYAGDLLPGLFVADAPEVERWIEAERTRLREMATNAIWSCAMARRRSSDPTAVALARRACAMDPGNEAGLRRLLSLLRERGDRAGAAREYERFRTWLRDEYGMQPSAESRALAEEIRTSDRRTPSRSVLAEGGRDDSRSPKERLATAGSDASLPRRRTPWGLAVAGLGLFLTAFVLQSMGGILPSTADSPPILAIGEIQDLTGDTAAEHIPALRAMLSAHLARLRSVRVMSADRVADVLWALQQDTGRSSLLGTIRQAGADEVLEGTLYRRPDGALRLDLTRTDLATGVLQDSYVTEGADPLALVAGATAQIFARLGEPAPEPSALEGQRSLAAYRLYEEGMRARRAGDQESAYRLFRAALDEDSTFTMAAYHAALVRLDDGRAYLDHLSAAMRMAEAAPEWERLLVRGTWADAVNDPARLAIADTLAVRYPYEATGHYLFGRALLWDGQFLRAVGELELARDMDSISLDKDQCATACMALDHLVTAYALADSTDAAERVARDWIRRDPGSVPGWNQLQSVLQQQARFDEALEVMAQAADLGGARLLLSPARAQLEIRRGGFAEADRRLQLLITSGMEVEGLWWLTISYRNQGRLTEALRAIGELRAGDPLDPVLRAHEAQVLFEMGRFDEQLALLDSAVTHLGYRGDAPGDRARHTAWFLAHRASGLAALGDTTALRTIADSLRVLGQQSAYGRDRLLHHHVEGLRAREAGDLERAAKEFRLAIFSPVGGYTRTNLELARVLLALDRAEEAVDVLQPALRGGLEASNLYVTHTELREALGTAFDRVGQPDSAAVQFRRVLDAWCGADPAVAARRNTLQRRLVILRGERDLEPTTRRGAAPSTACAAR